MNCIVRRKQAVTSRALQAVAGPRFREQHRRCDDACVFVSGITAESVVEHTAHGIGLREVAPKLHKVSNKTAQLHDGAHLPSLRIDVLTQQAQMISVRKHVLEEGTGLQSQRTSCQRQATNTTVRDLVLPSDGCQSIDVPLKASQPCHGEVLKIRTKKCKC